MPKNATKCPNCGQITDGDDCYWCKFPIRPFHVERDQGVLSAGEHAEVDKHTGIMVIENAANDIVEAKKALEAEIAAWEKFQQAEEARKSAGVEEANRVVKAKEIRRVTKAEEDKIVTDTKETGIATEVEEATIAGIDETLSKTVAGIQANEKAQLEEIEEVKELLNDEKAAHSKTQDVTSVVAELKRQRLYRKIVEPLASPPITLSQYKTLENYLEVVESINRDLNDSNIGTGEAIKRLREISPVTP